MSYLHRLPIDKVKLDRSFLVGMNEPHGGKLLDAVVSLCHSIGIKCVAEGVETQDQLGFLKDVACDYYQGYYFAQPMPVADIVALLNDHAGERARA